jgi:hypothetical protein
MHNCKNPYLTPFPGNKKPGINFALFNVSEPCIDDWQKQLKIFIPSSSNDSLQRFNNREEG